MMTRTKYEIAEKQRVKATTYGTLLVYLGITIWICRAAFFHGRVLWLAQGDEYCSYYSSLSFFVHWVRKGIFPLWNPLTMCGNPYGLHSISLFDLYHLAALFLDVNIVYNVTRFCVIWLKGVFLYLFLTRRGLPPFASFTGGLLWMFLPSGETDAGLFFLPLSFLLADRYIERKSRINFTLFTLTTALHSLNTNPHTFLYNSFFVLSYMFYREFTLNRSSLRGMTLIVLPFLLSGGLVMFHFARIFEAAPLSSRGFVYQVQVLLPLHYPLVLFPKLYESPLRPELGFILSRSLQRLFSSLPFLERVQGFVSPPYVGIFPIYALMSWLFIQKKNLIIGEGLPRFSVTALMVLILYLSLHPLFYLLVIQYLPFLSGAQGIGRSFQIYYFCFSVLAAWGMGTLSLRSQESQVALRKIQGFLVALIALLMGALALVRLSVFHLREKIVAKIESSLTLTDLEFQQKRAEEFFSYVSSITSFTNPHLILPLMAIAFLLLLFHLYHQGRIPTPLFKTLLLLFLVADLGLWNGLTVASSTPNELQRYSEAAEVIKEDSSLYRVMILDDGSLDSNTLFLRPESNMIFDIATPDGYGQLYPRRYVRFYHLLTKGTTPGKEWSGMLQQFNDFDEHLADLINVKYLVTSITNTKLDRKGYEKIAEVPPYKVYRNEDALPRVFIARNVHWASNEAEAADYVANYPQKLRETVLLEGTRPSRLERVNERAPARTERIDVRIYQPNFVEVKAELNSEGYLVMTDLYDPGWKAYVDGKEVPMRLSDYAFRAVRVGAGPHTIRWVYQPASLENGMRISAASLLLLLIILMVMKGTEISQRLIPR